MSGRETRRTVLPASAFLAIEVAFLAATHVLGGPPWTVVGMLAFLAPMATGFRTASLLLLAPSLAWLALFHVTGNRELFFPFAMHVAAFLAVSLAARDPRLGAVGGGLVVAVFLAIRILQRATLQVLTVELVVAAAILAAVLAALVMLRRRSATDMALVVAAALLAYAGLAL